MPLPPSAIGNDGVGQTLYLHTSPEFSMKKLLAAGEQRIASLGHVWRNRERGAAAPSRNSPCSNGIGRASPTRR